MEAIRVRLRKMKKKDGSLRAGVTESRYKYAEHVAAAFDVTRDKPFCVTFFFEFRGHKP
jgi:hypothetical protein